MTTDGDTAQNQLASKRERTQRTQRRSRFALGNYLKGAGLILDIFGSPSPSHSKSGPSRDAKALRQDWEAVGRDLYWAIGIEPKVKQTTDSSDVKND